MSNNIHNADFWELISKYKIEIPIIQRDYVQGREENKRIRKKIISKFKNASSEIPTKLDFIYGNVNNHVFTPLDGQQRLTTLYLYHLYFALRDKSINRPEIKVLFQKFTYKTRTSTREFFTKLLDSNFEISEQNKISAEIRNQNWFITFWENDPSVVSAINMMDEIHEQCYKSDTTFDELITVKRKYINFEFLELDKFGLSDDLYIKMNARGKSLSIYETFKADLIGHIKKNKWEDNKEYSQLFSTKIDGFWTDYFWNGGKNEKTFDAFFINFLQQFIVSELILRDDLYEKALTKYKEINIVKEGHVFPTDFILTHILDNVENLNPDFIDEVSFNKLYNLLDRFSELSHKTEVKTNLWINDFKTIDALINNKRITYPIRILYHAHSSYLLNNPVIDNFKYDNWIRVVRNIINNSTIDTISTFKGALLLIDELASGSNDIYNYLSKNSVKSNFASKQVKEEVFKSKLVQTNQLSIEDLENIEDTKLCHGRIEFVLKYIKNKTNEDYSQVAKIVTLFKKYFSEDDFSNSIRSLFLTIKDNKFYNYWSSFVYVVDLPKRCLIVNTKDLRNYSFGSYSGYFEELIHRLIENDDIELHVEEFKKSEAFESLPNWKQKVISNSKLLDKHCQSKMIAVSHDDKKCYLMNIGRPRNIDSLKKI